mmetsp:Transcript_33038/g.76151  ORF Transcript_33038/g.76151 Transcript_33038/m.76151 type:complete len:309 (+) Transcript_33038:639-1565(+)
MSHTSMGKKDLKRPCAYLGRELPPNLEPLASLLHLVVFAAPPPERVGVPVDPTHVGGGERHYPPEIFGVVAVPAPAPRDVQGTLWKPRVPRTEIVSRQQIHVVKDENVVLEFPLPPRNIEADVEKLTPVELATVVALLHHVDVEVAESGSALSPQEFNHVGYEAAEVGGAILFAVDVPEGDDDGDARRILVEGGGGGGTLGRARGVQSRSGAAAVAIAAALLFAVAAVVGRSALLARRVVLVRLKLLDSLVRTMLFAGLTLGLCFGDRGVFDLEGGGRVPLRGFRGGVGVKISLLAVGVRLRPSRGEG